MLEAAQQRLDVRRRALGIGLPDFVRIDVALRYVMAAMAAIHSAQGRTMDRTAAVTDTAFEGLILDEQSDDSFAIDRCTDALDRPPFEAAP